MQLISQKFTDLCNQLEELPVIHMDENVVQLINKLNQGDDLANSLVLANYLLKKCRESCQFYAEMADEYSSTDEYLKQAGAIWEDAKIVLRNMVMLRHVYDSGISWAEDLSFKKAQQASSDSSSERCLTPRM